MLRCIKMFGVVLFLTLSILHLSLAQNASLEESDSALVTQIGNSFSQQCKTVFIEENTSCEIGFGQECRPDGNITCDRVAALNCINGICQCRDKEYYDAKQRRCHGLLGAPCSKHEIGFCENRALCETSLSRINASVGYCAYQHQIPDNRRYISNEEFAALNGTRVQPAQLNLPNYTESVALHPRPRNELWTDAQVPYTLDLSFSEEQRVQIALAIQEFHKKTCIRFIPKESNHTSWLNIMYDPSVCAVAHRCMNNGPQFAKFGGNCVNAGVIIHQLGKTLCMAYQPALPNRDHWIRYNTSVCQPHEMDTLNLTRHAHKMYDYLSSQHPEEECTNGCIIPKKNGVTKCGSGGPLSVLDIETLNEMYGCQSGCSGYRYVKYSESLQNATAGYDYYGEPLKSCRIYSDGGLIPGYRMSALSGCFTNLNGTRSIISKGSMEILTIPSGSKFQWERTGVLPGNAFVGGRTSDREPLYVVRCKYISFDGDMVGWYLGNFQPSVGANTYRTWNCSPENIEFLVCN